MKTWKDIWTAQKTFDERVTEEKEVEPSVADRCAAFRIEMDELANELPSEFKWWSNKQNSYEKALVEYVDGLKFLVGKGIKLGVDSKDIHTIPVRGDSVKQLHSDCGFISHLIERELYKDGKGMFNELFSTYTKLGYAIGFTQDVIMQAYEDKHKVVNERLDGGY